MAAQNVTNVCLYFKFGYCKHKDCCRKKHVKEVCDTKACEISTCSLRHPKICKFYREYGQCKFNPCLFRHVDTIIDIDALKRENENILERLQTIDTKLEALNVKILESEVIIDKLNQVEKRMEIFTEMKKHIEEKDCQIGFLEKRINDVEANLFNKDKVIEELAEKIQNIQTSKGKKQEKIKCSFCDFEKFLNRV